MIPHQPVLSGYRAATTPDGRELRRQNQARCACGWRGHWFSSVKDVDGELREHIAKAKD